MLFLCEGKRAKNSSGDRRRILHNHGRREAANKTKFCLEKFIEVKRLRHPLTNQNDADNIFKPFRFNDWVAGIVAGHFHMFRAWALRPNMIPYDTCNSLVGHRGTNRYRTGTRTMTDDSALSLSPRSKK